MILVHRALPQHGNEMFYINDDFRDIEILSPSPIDLTFSEWYFPRLRV